MQFIFNPLIINVICILSIILFFRIDVKLLGYFFSRSSNVFQYKIFNIRLSLILIFCYISVIIILLYIIRLYNLPRSMDLKLLVNKAMVIQDLWIVTVGEYSFFGQVYIFAITLLCCIFVILLILRGHKLMYKEMHKTFLWLEAHPNTNKNIIYDNLKYHLHTLSLDVDLFYHMLLRLARFTISRGVPYNWDKIPYYNPYKILMVFKKYYKIIIAISPLLVVLYDCIFNNFIITHVFYYLIFYIPLRLLKRISDCVSMNAPYITKWLYELYYKDEDCLYAASPTLKAILDNFILSGIEMNFTLGVQNEAELVVCALTRFELADKHGPLDETYVNEDSQFIHTYDRIHYFHVIPNENGNPIHGTEWVLLLDKTKK